MDKLKGLFSCCKKNPNKKKAPKKEKKSKEEKKEPLLASEPASKKMKQEPAEPKGYTKKSVSTSKKTVGSKTTTVVETKFTMADGSVIT